MGLSWDLQENTSNGKPVVRGGRGCDQLMDRGPLALTCKERNDGWEKSSHSQLCSCRKHKWAQNVEE